MARDLARKPATEATISWSTKLNAESKLYLDTKSRDANVKKYKMTSKVVSGQFTTDEEDVFYHRAELTKLKSDTKYWFTLQTGKSVSQEFWFKTAPKKDAEFKFLYGGDSRSYREDRRKVNELIHKLIKEDPKFFVSCTAGTTSTTAKTGKTGLRG